MTCVRKRMRKLEKKQEKDSLKQCFMTWEEGVNTEDGDILFFEVPSARRRYNSLELQQGKFPIEYKK